MKLIVALVVLMIYVSCISKSEGSSPVKTKSGYASDKGDEDTYIEIPEEEDEEDDDGIEEGDDEDDIEEDDVDDIEEDDDDIEEDVDDDDIEEDVEDNDDNEDDDVNDDKNEKVGNLTGTLIFSRLLRQTII